MKKKGFIKRYGEEVYERRLEKARQCKARNPEQVVEQHHEQSHKGGKRYEKRLLYEQTGLQGERNKARRKHRGMWGPFKNVIAPESVLHHEWLPGTADYAGLALVEADQHMHGVIDVIEILEGEITLFTEKELLDRGKL
jgi:hypothetical protein